LGGSVALLWPCWLPERRFARPKAVIAEAMQMGARCRATAVDQIFASAPVTCVHGSGHSLRFT